MQFIAAIGAFVCWSAMGENMFARHSKTTALRCGHSIFWQRILCYQRYSVFPQVHLYACINKL